ncbi:MAG: hypothetical protein Q4D42_13370 [Eubacteriales bacterium]|nr:hypothetical protein [Eubacteriales bacterium]
MDNEKNLDSIVTDSVAKVVLKHTIPAVLAMLMVLIYNLADTFLSVRRMMICRLPPCHWKPLSF